MENRKYFDWIIANVQDSKIKPHSKLHPQTGQETAMYHLNHMVRIGGQYETIETAKKAMQLMKRHPYPSGAAPPGFSSELENSQVQLFGDYLKEFTVTFSNEQRLITPEDFFGKVFLRLRPGQNGYLPYLARECHKVLGNAITIGCQKAEAISRDNRERREFLSTDLKNTMNLMEKKITQDINDEVWTKDFKIEKETTEGRICLHDHKSHFMRGKDWALG